MSSRNPLSKFAKQPDGSRLTFKEKAELQEKMEQMEKTEQQGQR